MVTVIPTDPRTGKPRKGKWVNRVWAPDEPEPQKLLPQSNPSFELNVTVKGFKPTQTELYGEPREDESLKAWQQPMNNKKEEVTIKGKWCPYKECLFCQEGHCQDCQIYKGEA